MSENALFSAVAPAYFAKNIPVIPLHVGEKRPIPNGWNQFAEHMPSVDEQTEWLMVHKRANIGLVLGRCSGVSVMDIDTDDPSLIRMIKECLPESPWVRIGKKGMVLAFRYSGIKTFRIKTADGKSLCEFLSDKTQVVLPPSIHPDTKLPYVANCDLLDVIGVIPECPHDIEDKLRQRFQESGIQLSSSGWSRVTDYVAGGMRDIQLTEKAGLFAWAVLRGERTLKEAIGMLCSYNEEFVENVAGDPTDIEKHKRQLVQFLTNDVTIKKKILPEGWDQGLTAEEKKTLGVAFDKDQEEWTLEETMNYLKEEFDKDPQGLGGATMAIDKILLQMARSRNLSEMEKERILSYAAKSSKSGISIAAMRRQMRTVLESEGAVQGINHTEIATALQEEIEKVFPIRWAVGKFWKYNGAYWEILPDMWIKALISRNYGHMPAARKFNDISGIMKLLQATLPEDLPRRLGDTMAVNFANGVVEMTKQAGWALMPHSESYGMTYVLPFRSMSTLGVFTDLRREAPLFFKFLEDAWGADDDFDDKVKALQEMLAVTLFGQGASYQRAFLLHGVPKSGKSQLLKIVAALVPDEAKSAVNPADWSDTFAPAGMYRKLLNIAGELSEVRRIDGQRFKDIIDGSDISGRYMYQDPFRFRVTCTHWFASNHFPRTDDTSDGFTRRWLVLDFRHPVKPGEMKINLGDDIIAAEREVIAAWAIEGMARLLRQKDYTLPRSHREVVSEMANLNNVVRAFVTGCKEIVVGEGGSMSEMDVYQAFWGFNLNVTQMRAMGVPAFRSKMRELAGGYGFSVAVDDVTGEVRYLGLKKGKR